MTGAPVEMTDAPRSPGWEEDPAAELLSQVLATFRLSSAVFLRGEFRAPWGVSTPPGPEIAALLEPGSQRLALLHAVLEGECTIALDSGQELRARAGDVAVLPGGDGHVLRSAARAACVPLADRLPPAPWRQVPLIREGGEGRRTRILCAYLRCEPLASAWLLGGLPPLFRVRPPPGPASTWLEATLGYALAEAEDARPGRASLVARLPELLFLDCLRQYASECTPAPRGWLAAARDPALARALSAVHAEPARAWTVPALARRAGVSRSVLAERFSRALGITPMRYVARWRLQLAARQLRTTDRGLAEIGAAAGYGSEEGFSRAFRRWAGQSPGAWRKEAGARPRGDLRPATEGAPAAPTPPAAWPGSPGHRP